MPDPDDIYESCRGCGDRVIGLTFGLCGRCFHDECNRPEPEFTEDELDHDGCWEKDE